MAKETERFASFKQKCAVENKMEPKADGVLIFDEVKVISRLMWNSRSHKVIGLAMSPAVTIRVALAVYCRSPSAYGALKSFGLLQLPSRSTLQAYTGAFLEDCGKQFQ